MTRTVLSWVSNKADTPGSIMRQILHLLHIAILNVTRFWKINHFVMRELNRTQYFVSLL